MAELSIPLIGDRAPEFEAQTTKGKISFPKDYTGKWVVLFSHPADFTPVCTTEFVAFAKRYEKFQELNAELIGLSIDQVFSHIKWTEWIKENLDVEIPFPIIADNTGKIAEKFGMLHPEAAGTQTVRAVFLVDPKGIVRAMLYYPLSNGRNMDEILRLLKALQTTDQYKVATPAGWPDNELIGGKVIVPPPVSEKEIAERKGKYECYDWWLCYKEVE
jgi:peroxiredoxin (alkyl hydroperoxide reductase subunit C)